MAEQLNEHITLQDLNLVYRETFDGRNRWQNILLALGVNKATIESIGVKYRDDPDACYREGLSEWLKGEERNWRDLVEALSSPTVGHNDIAKRIKTQLTRDSSSQKDPEKPYAEYKYSRDSESDAKSLGNWSAADVDHGSFFIHDDHPDQTPSGYYNDRRTVTPESFHHPSDESLVGKDLGEAAASRQEAPTGNSYEGKLLSAFQCGDFETANMLLSRPKSNSQVINSICDSDGKTLLHLACQKEWIDWSDIVHKLVQDHSCDVSVVDEDGNTPLHEAYQCGNWSFVRSFLSLPTLNLDAANKQQYTVLRMALEKNDKVAVRELLATGRVDPRRRTSRGHTYRELLEMNQLQPAVDAYDESALQMVEQLAECIDANSHVQPPFPSFKHYYLLGILNEMFKNRQKVLIGGLVERIKENMLPLPEEPAELYDLLIKIENTVNSFILSNPGGESFENVEVRLIRQGQVYGIVHSEKRSSMMVQSRQTASVSTHSRSSPESRINVRAKTPSVAKPSDITEPKQLLFHKSKSPVDTPKLERGCCGSCRFNFNRSKLSYNKCCSKRSNKLWVWICCCGKYRLHGYNRYCCCMLVALFLILLAVLFLTFILLAINNRNNSTTIFFNVSTTIVQLAQPSTPLIARINFTIPEQVNELRFTEIIVTDRAIPIEFYVGDCPEVRLENKTINVQDGFFPTFTNSIYEQHTPFESTLSIRIQLPSISSNNTQCVASLLVFDSLGEYNFFLTNQTWMRSFREFCIQSSDFNTTVTLLATTYYYFGLYISDKMFFDDLVFYQITGIIQQYSIDTLAFACSINSAQNNKCDVTQSTLDLTPSSDSDVCIVGSVLQRLENELAFQAKVTVDGQSFFSAQIANNIFISMILFTCGIGLAIILVFCIGCCYKSRLRLPRKLDHSRSLSDLKLSPIASPESPS